MDLKALLNKTAKKNKDFDVPKIKPFSIAMDDRPYDELIPKDNVTKKSSDVPQIIEKPPEPEVFIPLPIVAAQPKIVETSTPSPKAIKPIKEIKTKVKVKKTEIEKIEPKKPLQEQKRAQEKASVKTVEPLPSIKEIESFATNILVNDMPPLEEPRTAFLLLSGCQKKIVDYFFELTIKNNTSKIGPITTDTGAMTLELTAETFKKSIQRLKQKGIIYTSLSKEGRGGWSIYEFNTAFYQELISNARLKSGFKVDTQPVINHILESASPSRVGDLPAIWANLEYQDLSEYGFTKSHLIQIYKDQEKASVILDLESMQYSLDAFKFDMENNQNILKERLRNKSPVMFLTQILGKGRPYGSFTPEKFKTPEQIAILRYKEKQELVNKELQSIKDTYFETEFQSWYENLTDKDSEELIAHLDINLSSIPQKLRSAYKMRSFKEHFSQVVWLDVVKHIRKQ